MELLTVSNISLAERGTSVLTSINFTQSAQWKLALAGESGAGKSTLLQTIAGLIQPSTGEVRVAGSRVRGPAETLVPGHAGVAYLPQQSALPPSLRVEQVLRYANKRPATEAQAVYELCRITQLAGQRTDQLSGGEQQRVALARLLLGAPRLLLLDEPYANLDRTHKRQMQAIVEELGTRLGITILLVSHDAADTLAWADEILVLRRGCLVQQGSPTHLYHHPVDEYTAALFGDYTLMTEAMRRQLAPTSPHRPDAGLKPLMVRPEQFRLGSKSSRGIAGTVLASRFHGSYWEVEVALPTMIVRVRASSPAPAVGDPTWVSLAAGAGWELGGSAGLG